MYSEIMSAFISEFYNESVQWIRMAHELRTTFGPSEETRHPRLRKRAWPECIRYVTFNCAPKWYQGVKETTTGTAATTQEINDLIGWMRNNRARFSVHFASAFCWRNRPNDDVNFSATPQYSKSFILCFYMETVRTKKQAKVYFAYFVQLNQHGVIAKHLTQRKVQF